MPAGTGTGMEHGQEDGIACCTTPKRAHVGRARFTTDAHLRLGTMWQSGKSLTCLCLAQQREHMQFKKTPTITSRHCESRVGLLDNPA